MFFYDKDKSTVEVYDTRNPGVSPFLNVQALKPVRKIVFNPYNKNNCYILFDNYFSVIDLCTWKIQQSYVFESKKIYDMNFNEKVEGEFLITGDTNNPEYHCYIGFLNVNKF